MNKKIIDFDNPMSSSDIRDIEKAAQDSMIMSFARIIQTAYGDGLDAELHGSALEAARQIRTAIRFTLNVVFGDDDR